MIAPALVPATPVVAGVAWRLVYPHGPLVDVWLLAGVWLGWLAAVAGLVGRRSTVVSIAVALGALLVGSIVGADAARQLASPSIRHLHDAGVLRMGQEAAFTYVEGRLTRDATPTDYGASVSVDVERVVVDGRCQAAAGGIAVSVGGAFTSGAMDSWRSGRSVRLPVYLRRPVRYWNPGLPDQERAIMRRGVALLGSTKSARLIEVQASGTMLQEAAAAVRAAVRRLTRDSVGRWSLRSSGIVTALLIGDRTGLDPVLLDRLRAAGTYHVLAISGGNIAILVGLVVLIFQGLGMPPRSAAALAAAVVVAYAMVVGPEASVVRATFVAVVYLAARASDLRTSPVNALAVAAMVTAVLAPSTLFDVGFTLSFGAALAIVVGAHGCATSLRRVAAWTPLDRLNPRVLDPVLALLAATICAEVVLLPVSAFVFSQVSIAGLGLNFIAIPLMTVVQIAGLLAVAVATWSPLVGAAPGLVAHLAAEGLVRSASLVELLPWLAAHVPSPSPWLLVAYYGALVVWLVVPASVPVRRGASLVTGGLLLCVLGGLTPRGATRGAGFEAAAGPSATQAKATQVADPQVDGEWPLVVTALDVGQGDATLVRFPDGQHMLVDAGGSLGSRFDIGARVVVPALWALGVTRLDRLVLTHGDPDHAGGALAVIEDLTPREIWEGVPVPSSIRLQTLRAGAAQVGSVWRAVRTGVVTDVAGVRLSVLHPPRPDWERPRVRNDDSVVLELRIGDVSIVLTGDIGEEVERTLEARLEPAGLRVLKIPHHGSRSSSSAGFVAAARPRVAFVSAGRANRFGHPVPAVVRRYREAGAHVLRTDRDGAITLATDGRLLRVVTMSGRFLEHRARPLPLAGAP